MSRAEVKEVAQKERGVLSRFGFAFACVFLSYHVLSLNSLVQIQFNSEDRIVTPYNLAVSYCIKNLHLFIISNDTHSVSNAKYSNSRYLQFRWLNCKYHRVEICSALFFSETLPRDTQYAVPTSSNGDDSCYFA